jgi:tRNA pseudouridine55 synthase
MDKSYIARIRFGSSTDSGDSEGKVLSEWEPDYTLNFYHTHRQKILEKIQCFTSLTSQIPPQISALKVNGKRSSDLFRHGTPIEISPRPTTIYSSQVISEEPGSLTFDVRVSSGTYIRKLVIDLSDELSFPMHLDRLIRTSIHRCTLQDSHSLEEIKNNPNLYKSLQEMVDLQQIVITDDSIQKIKKGMQVPTENLPKEEFLFVGTDRKVYARCKPKTKHSYQYLRVFENGI